jgi:hypothetical protein
VAVRDERTRSLDRARIRQNNLDESWPVRIGRHLRGNDDAGEVETEKGEVSGKSSGEEWYARIDGLGMEGAFGQEDDAVRKQVASGLS